MTQQKKLGGDAPLVCGRLMGEGPKQERQYYVPAAPLERGFMELTSLCFPVYISFSVFTLLTFWTVYIYTAGVCTVYCRMFSSIPDLCLLGTSSTTLPAVTVKNASRECQTFVRGNIDPFEKHVCKYMLYIFLDVLNNIP